MKCFFLTFGGMEKARPNTEFPELDLIAKRLRELRKSKGYNNYEHIAFDLGMSRSAYWKLEAGSNFEMKTLIKVCRLLGVTLEEFFEGIKVPEQK